MANEMPGLIGRKIGMTQIFADNGTAIAVTVVEAGPNAVLQVKSADGTDGYNAVQLGFADKKPSRTTQAEQGHFDKAGTSPKKHVVEFRLAADAAAAYTAGQELGVADVFAEGDAVDVIGTSKGRGFAGVMKRHGFRGFIRTHGTHEYFRHGGSIGTRLTPGHVLKGKKMGGHMGAERVTIQNLKVVKLDADNNLLYIKGGIPGPNGGIVRVRKAVKA